MTSNCSIYMIRCISLITMLSKVFHKPVVFIIFTGFSENKIDKKQNHICIVEGSMVKKVWETLS